jgi:hypothetical protein
MTGERIVRTPNGAEATLTVDGSGALNCKCGYLAIDVSGRDPTGRHLEGREPYRPGVPRAVICVFCLKPREQCGPPCAV